MAGRCQFYSSGAGYLHDVYQTEVRAGAGPPSDPRPLPGATALPTSGCPAPACLCRILTTCLVRSLASGVTFTLDSQWPPVHVSSLCGF